MKKYLMKGFAAIVFCGAIASCSHDMDSGSDAVQTSVVEKYEKAFVTHFGEPAATQTWGFGSSSAQARTRAAVAAPTEVGPTFNATLAAMSDRLAAAIATGTDVNTYFSNFTQYQSWWNSGWNDTYYQIPAIERTSTYSEDYLTQIRDIILEQIPEQGNNLSKATSTGYSITTTGGPVTLTPVYHNSNSGDKISYYYYPANTNPTVEEIKALPKYTIGNMADPEICNSNHTSFYRKTFTLVYVNEAGEAFDEFPAGYKINFIISNTWTGNGNLTIYQSGGETTTTGGSEVTLTSQGKYTLSSGDTFNCGDTYYSFNQAQIRYGKAAPAFKAAKQEGSVTGFTAYTEGNGVNGNLDGGSTVYYIKPYNSGRMKVAVVLNTNARFYIKDLGNENWDATSGTSLTGYDGKEVSEKYYGTYEFPVEGGHVYAVYATGSKLGFYGYEFYYGNNTDLSERKAVSEGESFACGTGYLYGSQAAVRFGKNAPAFSAATGNEDVNGYSAYTAGNGVNGSLNGGSTVYYIKPWNTGVMQVAVNLNANKEFYIQDLGNDNWDATSGTSLAGYDGITVASDYKGTYQFPVEGGHVYAIYATGSKLGFYGCEFFTQASGNSQANSSVSDIVTTTIANNPEYYGDGRLNTAIHSSGLYTWNLPDAMGYNITEPATPHVAVFSIGNKNYVGFEDWHDFDYNDVIFEVTGTEGGEKIEVEEIEESDEIVVLAEDLTIDDVKPDFDFNDVVFKVTRYTSGEKSGQVWVTLLAAGGTLHLTVDGHEVHEEFAKTNPDKVIVTTTMINTAENAHTAYKTASFQVTNPSGSNIQEIANNIPVVVTKFGKQIPLVAPTGGVPSKIAVKTDFLTDPNMGWCDEQQDIDEKYNVKGTALFKDYVRGELDDNWYTLITTKGNQ